MMAHKDLRLEDVRCVIDSREQAPLELLLPYERGTLFCGDYSVKGLENRITIERKSTDDLLACVGRERERFEACIKRMQAYEVRALVIETTWGNVELGQWRSHLKPTQVKAALYSWMKHMSVILAGDRHTTASIVSGILFSAARERWRELQSFIPTLKIAGEANGARRAERPQVDPGGGQRDGEVDRRGRPGDPAAPETA